MSKVQFAMAGWLLVGTALGLAVVALWPIALTAIISAWGLLVVAAYLAVVAGLLLRAFARHGSVRFGAANAVTSVRAALVGVITGLIAVSLVHPLPPLLVVALATPALILDGVDGWVARRTGSATELGARFDMEVDAFFLLVLSVAAAFSVGPWVLAIGVMRYAFVGAAAIWPWLNRALPFRYWRKVVTAAVGVALILVMSGLVAPVIGVTVAVVALLLLVESFGRDVLWLFARRRASGED